MTLERLRAIASSTAFSCCRSSSLREDVLLFRFGGGLASGFGFGGSGALGSKTFEGELFLRIILSFLGMVMRTGSLGSEKNEKDESFRPEPIRRNRIRKSVSPGREDGFLTGERSISAAGLFRGWLGSGLSG